MHNHHTREKFHHKVYYVKCSLISHTDCRIAINQYWQTSGPKFGPTRYPAYQSIHWAGIRLGMLSPAPNQTQFGRTQMYAKCGLGRQFFKSAGSVFACRKPSKTSVEPLMKWDCPTRHFLCVGLSDTALALFSYSNESSCHNTITDVPTPQ